MDIRAFQLACVVTHGISSSNFRFHIFMRLLDEHCGGLWEDVPDKGVVDINGGVCNVLLENCQNYGGELCNSLRKLCCDIRTFFITTPSSCSQQELFTQGKVKAKFCNL